MESAWDNRITAVSEHELSQLVQSTRLLGTEKSLVLTGYGSASVKTCVDNLFGGKEEILVVSGRDKDLETIETSGFAPMRRDALADLIELQDLTDAQLENVLACNRVLASAPLPHADALLHAILPHKYVHIAHPYTLAAIACTPGGKDRLFQIYGDSLAVVPYARSGLPLAKACAAALQASAERQIAGIVLLNHGLVTFGETARASYERLIDLVARAEQYLKHHRAWEIAVPTYSAPDKPVREELAALRKAVSDVAGFPVLLSTFSDPFFIGCSRRDDLADIVLKGPPVADHVRVVKRLPLLDRDVAAYGTAHGQYLQEHATAHPLTRIDPAPRVILDPDLGLCTVGRTADETVLVSEVCLRSLEAILRATALDAYQSLDAAELFEAEYASIPLPTEREQVKTSVFAGEIALVTGGASGIGKACVQSLLARGAAVVSLDIDPVVTTFFDRPDYLGLQCDLVDEAAILQSFERMVRTFGGLDMLVLNAGIFPPSRRIDSMQLDHWQEVMRINLDSNLSIMREAYPLLKLAPRSGRVLVNASKNVLAPGAGVAAYSASKAATTQLARVAALEWGKDRIRINMIHPDAVFDTGIWSEDKIQARAAHYGMTVQEYKTRNVLGVELDSHYVGELVAEMLGPLFAKITGAQIPVDGGSDRVI